MCGHQGAGALTPPGFSTDAESQREADLAYLVPRATTAPSPICICRVKKNRYRNKETGRSNNKTNV